MHLTMSSSFSGKAVFLAIVASSTTTTTFAAETSYGVDVSFPMHHPRVVVPGSSGDASSSLLLPGRQDFYDAFLENCRHHDHDACDENENDRIAMNLRQPQSMVNYTKTGYAKATVPDGVFKVIRKFWEDNLGREEVEEWYTGNTYTNHWESHTWMLSLDDDKLAGSGSKLKNMIWEVARHALEEWTGQELTPTSLYGIRKYTSGSILSTHVDRLPLVASAIINVAQDVDEPWPLEVIGHDGLAHNVTIQPGEMILYESHSVLHGRPFPLKGRYYANVFIHFEPVGHSRDHGFNPDNDAHYESLIDIKAGFNHNGGLPPYIVDGSLEAFQWRRENPDEDWEPRWAYEADEEEGTGSNGAHYASHTGNVELLEHIIVNPQHRKDMIFDRDANGWAPIHEGARNGHEDVVRLLVKHGVDINERTNFGRGQSVLNMAYEYHEEDSSFIHFLIHEMGAVDIEDGQEL